MTRIGPLFATSLAAALCFAQGAPAATEVPVSVITTVKAPKDAPPPTVTQDDVLVSQNKRNMQVTSFAPLRDQGGLQLWILIDDGSASALGSQLSDLREFVRQQPSATQIGVGYMRNGSVTVVQPLTSNRDLATKAMRLPIGVPGISASPYLALTELIHKWPAGPEAREVLMVSSGMDPDYGAGPDNPYLNRAIDTAQRAGVVVYSIYFPGAGRFGRGYRRINWGQNYLSQLSEETGGEFYWEGNHAPVSLSPYLDNINRRLNEQYLLTFLAEPQNKPGFQTIRLSTEVPQSVWQGREKYTYPASNANKVGQAFSVLSSARADALSSSAAGPGAPGRACQRPAQ